MRVTNALSHWAITAALLRLFFIRRESRTNICDYYDYKDYQAYIINET